MTDYENMFDLDNKKFAQEESIFGNPYNLHGDVSDYNDGSEGRRLGDFSEASIDDNEYREENNTDIYVSLTLKLI